MKIDLSKPSAARRFKAVFSGLYDLGIDIIEDIETRGYTVPISSFLMKIAKSRIIPNTLDKYTTKEEHKKSQMVMKWELLQAQEEERALLEEKKCQTMIEIFIAKSAAYWPQIKEKDINFLVLNSAVLFNDLPENYVKGFCDLFKMKDKGLLVIPEKNIEDLWDFLQAMVRISIRHVHTQRKPNYVDVVSKGEDGKASSTKEMQYTEEYFPTLKVSKLVELWQIKAIYN